MNYKTEDMKKQILLCTSLLAVGLAVGYLSGWIVSKHKMQVEVHDNAVRALSEMSEDLQDATAEWYAKSAYNIRGDLFEKGTYYRSYADQTLYFVATFLSNYTDYRQRKDYRFTIKSEKEIRAGRAIPIPSNTEYYIQMIQIDAQRIAEDNSKRYTQ